jgi:hypothetical protein
VLIGGGILWESGMRLQHVELAGREFSALWIAIATVLQGGAVSLPDPRRRAPAFATADRQCPAYAGRRGLGAGGRGRYRRRLLGWSFLDLLAAALMGFMILRMGAGLAWGAIKELIDTGLDDAQVEAIRETLLATPGVRDLHELRTRRMAHQALVDTHVQVDSRISVSEGHRIAESARARVLREHPEVLDVLVHIDPEDDMDPDTYAPACRARVLLAELQPLPACRASKSDIALSQGQVEARFSATLF